jgi:hypothetical protein
MRGLQAVPDGDQESTETVPLDVYSKPYNV